MSVFKIWRWWRCPSILAHGTELLLENEVKSTSFARTRLYQVYVTVLCELEVFSAAALRALEFSNVEQHHEAKNPKSACLPLLLATDCCCSFDVLVTRNGRTVSFFHKQQRRKSQTGLRACARLSTVFHASYPRRQPRSSYYKKRCAWCGVLALGRKKNGASRNGAVIDAEPE